MPGKRNILRLYDAFCRLAASLEPRFDDVQVSLSIEPSTGELIPSLKMIRICFLVSAGASKHRFTGNSSSSEDDDQEESPTITKNTSGSNHSISVLESKTKKRSKKKDSSSAKRLKSTVNDPKSLMDCEEVRADLSQQSSLLKQLLRQLSDHRQQLNEIQQCYSRREKTQLEILKNQKKLAKALNNRDVRSRVTRNANTSSAFR